MGTRATQCRFNCCHCHIASAWNIKLTAKVAGLAVIIRLCTRVIIIRLCTRIHLGCTLVARKPQRWQMHKHHGHSQVPDTMQCSQAKPSLLHRGLKLTRSVALRRFQIVQHAHSMRVLKRNWCLSNAHTGCCDVTRSKKPPMFQFIRCY